VSCTIQIDGFFTLLLCLVISLFDRIDARTVIILKFSAILQAGTYRTLYDTLYNIGTLNDVPVL